VQNKSQVNNGQSNDDDDVMESESLSSNDGGSGNIRINLKAGEAEEEARRHEQARPSQMDVDRTDSLIESNIDTEKEEELYEQTNYPGRH
jgi:hypothetical protein